MVRGIRYHETVCASCGQVVGVVLNWNTDRDVKRWRSSKHYVKHGDIHSGVCNGSRAEIPPALVLDGGRRA